MRNDSQNNNNATNIAVRVMRRLATALVTMYQVAISPFTGGRAACRFVPTCSEYTKQAIEKHGVMRGIVLGLKRISRCRPGGGFGFDPVP